MSRFKKYSTIVILASLLLYFGFKYFDYFYYSSFKGNDKIKFVHLDTTGLQTYGDLFKLPLFKNKVTFVNVSFYADNVDHKQDLPYFKLLYEKFHDRPFQILYTNSEFDDSWREAKHKKILKNNEAWGLHAKVPEDIRSSMVIKSVDSNQHIMWTYPKYLLVDKYGNIDTFAPRPSKFDLLTKRVEELLTR